MTNPLFTAIEQLGRTSPFHCSSTVDNLMDEHQMEHPNRKIILLPIDGLSKEEKASGAIPHWNYNWCVYQKVHDYVMQKGLDISEITKHYNCDRIDNSDYMRLGRIYLDRGETHDNIRAKIAPMVEGLVKTMAVPS